MNFLAPGALGLGLLLPIIVAFYLLKLRRIEQTVASVFLWRKMIRDVEANAPWQKLRYNLLMILQLLFLAVLIFAVARPYTRTAGASGQTAIFILDTSASMSATDMTPTRFESARQRARQMIDEMPATARLTIIEAGSEAQVRLSSSTDRRQAHLAVESIQPGSAGSDMTTALELASAIAARQPDTEIIVFSDGQVRLPDRLVIKGRLRFLPFGLNGDNQAISLLNLEKGNGGSTLTAFAQVANYAERSVARRLLLYADGLLFNVYDLADIPAGGQQAVVIEGLPYNTQVVEARLESVDEGSVDILPLDDRAISVMQATKKLDVLLLTSGNLFLRTILSSLPEVQLTEIAPDDPAQVPQATPASTAIPTPTPSVVPAAPLPAADLYIFDGTLPETMPDSGSLLFIAPPRSTTFFSTTGLLPESTPRLLDPSDPLLSYLTFDQVHIFESINIPLPEWALPVVAGDLQQGSTNLIMRGTTGGRRVALLSFALYNSDLPLTIAFPVLMRNMVTWLAPGAGSPIPASMAAGESLALIAPEGIQAAVVTRPDGSTIRLQAEDGRLALNDTQQLGLYELNLQNAAEPQPIRFAVNLFSPQESNLKPADQLPGLAGSGNTSADLAQEGKREWWRLLALLALGLLLGEWLVYQRAALARLRDLLRQQLTAWHALPPKR